MGPVLLLIILGAISSVTQLILGRELTSTLAGNEIVLGIVLGGWMIITALGTALKNLALAISKSSQIYIALLCLLPLITIIQVIFIRLARVILGLGGLEVSPCFCTVLTLTVLSPFCILNGLLLTAGAFLLQTQDLQGLPSLSVGRAYGADSLGWVIGGILFAFCLVWLLDHITALACIGACLIAFFIIPKGSSTSQSNPSSNTKRRWVLFQIAVLGVYLSVLLFDIEEASTQAMIAPQTKIFKANSPYGRVVIGTSGSQTNIWQNGVVVYSIPDVAHSEELTHYAMCQRTSPKRVLLLSGSIGNLIQEVLKYNPENIDCVELDPGLLKAIQRLHPQLINHSQVAFVCDDPRRFVKRTTNQYDVVILNTPDPASLQLNRMYTLEFFNDVCARLSENGVCITQLGSYQNYLSKDSIMMFSSLAATLKTVFSHVTILPGLRLYFISSQAPLDTNIVTLLRERGITVNWLRKEYLEAILTPSRLGEIQTATTLSVPKNTDYRPYLVNLKLKHWTSQFRSPFPTFVSLAALVAVGYTLIKGRLSTALFFSGFSAAVIEIIVLILAQIITGALYYQLTALITAFMAGVALGSWLGAGFSTLTSQGKSVTTLCISNAKRYFAITFVCVSVLMIMPLAVKPCYTYLGFVGTTLVLGLFSIFAGACLGWQIALASLIQQFTSNESKPMPHKIFSLDFLGGCMGMLLAPIILVPTYGIITTCCVCGGANLLVGLSIALSKRL